MKIKTQHIEILRIQLKSIKRAISNTKHMYQERIEAKAYASREKKRNKINPKQAEGRMNRN